jgi:hypothetical protein
MAEKNEEMTLNDIDLLALKYDELDDDQNDNLYGESAKGGSLTIWDLQNELKKIGKYKALTTLDENGDKKVYNLIGDKEVTGLLRDVRTLATTTVKLSPEERRKKPFAMEAFAAYVMYYCAKKISYWSNDPDKVLEVMNKPAGEKSLYVKMLDWVKNDFKTGNLQEFRAIVTTAADRRQKDLYDMERAAKRKPEGGYASMTIEREDGTVEDSPDLAIKCIKEAAAAVRSLERKEIIETALEDCSRKKLLTDEQLEIICCSYGLGDGFEEMKKQDIAAKLGKSNSYISVQLKKSFEILRKYIIENKLM